MRRKQELKTGCKSIKKVYDKSRYVRLLSQRKEERPSEPTEGQDIKINLSMRGHEIVVADKHSSVS